MLKSFQNLTRFERGLWLVSVAAVLVSAIFGGKENLPSALCSLIGVTALIFIARGDVLGQILSIAFALLYGIISLTFSYYGEVLTYLGMSLPMALLSLISWLRHPYKTEERKEVAVGHVGAPEAVLLFALATLVTLVFYFLLKALGTANLGVSTLSVATSFVAAYLTFRRTERGRAALAAWSLTRAPLRRIHSMNAAAQFAHSMATLLAAGLPLPRALEVTANVVSNYTFSLAVRQVRQDVERGRPMAESMAGIECFPAMLTEMVGVGEHSGALEETLDVIGGYYDNEVSVTTARLLAVLEPAITIALAVLVVLLLLAVYLPMFTLYGGI